MKQKQKIACLAVAAALAATLCTGCQSQPTQESPAPGTETPQSSAPAQVSSVAELNYSNVNFDFADEIAALKEEVLLVPQAADIPLTVSEAGGASGMVLTPSVQEGHEQDYYLNAYVAGSALTFTADQAVQSAESSVSGALEVTDDTFTLTPAPLQAAQPADEVITVTMADGAVYRIHTVHELMPTLKITAAQVAEENQGVYDFAVDKFFFRVSTEGEMLYYRNMNCVGESMAENFAAQVTPDGTFYTGFVELRVELRNVNGGYSSGLYLVMDENYTDVDTLTLLPNQEANHTHGEGYLDQHEFLVLGDDHYLTLSYTPLEVSNLPDTVSGVDGTSTAYVWAGIFQEVKDGQVVAEINTTDYPLLYDSAIEKRNYAGSTDQGIDTTNGQGDPVFSLAEGFQDYVHPNSLDYTLKADGSVDKLLVSMRDQCAVYQFDMATGAMEWILGGKASTFTGYEDYTTTRKDEDGTEFTALSYGQHFARYMNKTADHTLDGNPVISVFDNQTGDAPFLMQPPAPTMAPTLTRTFVAELDPAAGTAQITDVINGTDLNALSDGYHIASHCGSVQYNSDSSVVIGWGLHSVVDTIAAQAPQGTITDSGYDDLRQGSRPIFTEYDMAAGEITFELYAERNPLLETHEALFSYRTYKTVG